MAKLGRLRSRADFGRVRSARDAVSLKSMLVFRAPGETEETRLGISVTRRTGNAVVRNRIRRRLRAAFAAELDPTLGPLDIIAVGRPGAVDLPYAELRRHCQRVYSARLRSRAGR